MKLRDLFREKDTHTAVVQTAGKQSHPFSLIDRYIPLSNPEMRLYSELREAIPIIDAAILKTVRLAGGFRVECSNPLAQQQMDEFVKGVQVGALSSGLDSFVSAYLDQLITYGTAVGEMVISQNADDIAALYLAKLSDIELKTGDNPLNTLVCVKNGVDSVPVKNQAAVLLSALDPSPDEPYGRSVLKGLPFVSSVLLKIYNTTGLNFDRVGNVRFAVTYRPTSDVSNVREKAQAIADEWSKAMKNTDGVSDFISVGDVDIKVIGADNQVLDTEIPVRQMLEQIVAKMGIPPFLLGLSWSSTERMSQQQCDILTSELEAYRRILDPVISKIANTLLRVRRLQGEARVIWEPISLLDQTELAKARLYEAQTEKIKEESAVGKP